MKISELIQDLSKLDPNLDILFTKGNWSSELSIDSELVSGYSVGHADKHNVFGIRPPIFVDYKNAHKVCASGKTYLDFRSKHIRPAVYLRSIEPDFKAAYDKYQEKQIKQLELFPQEEHAS